MGNAALGLRSLHRARSREASPLRLLLPLHQGKRPPPKGKRAISYEEGLGDVVIGAYPRQRGDLAHCQKCPVLRVRLFLMFPLQIGHEGASASARCSFFASAGLRVPLQSGKRRQPRKAPLGPTLCTMPELQRGQRHLRFSAIHSGVSSSSWVGIEVSGFATNGRRAISSPPSGSDGSLCNAETWRRPRTGRAAGSP